MRKRIKTNIIKFELVGKTIKNGENYIKIATFDKPVDKKKEINLAV